MCVVQAALKSENNSQYEIARMGLEITAMLLKKNADYGDSAFRPPLLTPDLDVQGAILVRMSDKIERLKNLASGHKAQVDEGFKDTMKDLCGYALLWLVQSEVRRLRSFSEGESSGKN